MNPILTERLELRPLARRDLRELHRLYADPVLMRWITGHPRTPWETRARLKMDLEHHREHGFGLCLARLRATGEVVGRGGLIPDPRLDGLVAEIAWMIVQERWGRGLATEMARALLTFAFDELGLGRVWARAWAENEASVRMMRKLGMREVEAEEAGQVRFEIVGDEAGVAARARSPSDGP